MAIKKIAQLYRIEKAIKDLSSAEKHRARQEKAVPLLKDFKKWLDKSAMQVLPKSAIGVAIRYSLNQWHKLIGYVDSGDTNIDNNRAERAVKPFVIGRKNWLFSNTANGANASAVLLQHYRNSESQWPHTFQLPDVLTGRVTEEA
ncbi:MAG: transposase [Enterobacterales bacterium]|nr:transposase [Enterobacterales bacterium]